MALKKGIWSGPILDNHFHLNPQGRYLDAANDFQRAGGTHLVLIHCPDFANPPTTYDEHFSSYSDTCDTAQKVRETSGLDVRVVLGPHPAALPINSKSGLVKKEMMELKWQLKIIGIV